MLAASDSDYAALVKAAVDEAKAYVKEIEK